MPLVPNQQLFEYCIVRILGEYLQNRLPGSQRALLLA